MEMRIPTSLATLLAAVALPAAALAAETATATLTAPNGAAVGTVTLTQGPKGVLVSADMHGLAPGAHGFHIHEAGACAPDFDAAGGHYNPGGGGHGVLDAGGYHAGDLPNIHAGADGVARADYFTVDVTLADGAANSVFDADGSAIVVHENPDSYGADAGAGGRVACGVITRN
jgi:Cu-Zn family superoxide dismutase